METTVEKYYSLSEDTPVIVSKPVTYQFRFKPAGWLIATINDQTGEFQITSDWGNYAFRWDPDPRCLGEKDLTHFLAKAGSNYIANKLGYGDNRNLKDVVDQDETLKAIRKEICHQRRSRYIDEDQARELWDRADEWADAEFNDYALPSELYEMVIEGYLICHKPSYEYLTLTKLLLPTIKKYLNEVVIPSLKEQP